MVLFSLIGAISYHYNVISLGSSFDSRADERSSRQFDTLVTLAMRAIIAILFSQAAASKLQQRMQQVLEEVTKDTSTKWGDDSVMQLSFKSATEEFTVAAGTVKTPANATRPATVDDTFMYVSGTRRSPSTLRKCT